MKHEHAANEVLCMGLEEKAGQAEGADEAAGQNVFVGQTPEQAALVRPELFPTSPAEQFVHCAAPGREKVPGGQIVHGPPFDPA